MNVRIQKSLIHGRGVFANEPLEEGDWSYVHGDVRLLLPGDPIEHYGVVWDDDLTYVPFAPWCCLNHSSTPNCVVDEVHSESPMMCVTALRDIEKDEELTLDYGYDPSED